MATDDGGHVAHPAVAVFYVSSIEQFLVTVVVWEMLIQKIQEVPGNVGCRVLVELGFEPYNVAFAVTISRFSSVAWRTPCYVGDHYF